VSQKKISFTLKELSKIIDASITGDENIVISNIATIQEANAKSITFLSNKKYLKFLDTTQAAAVIINSNLETNSSLNLLKCSDPYLAYAKISSLFVNKENKLETPSIHKSASICSSADVSKLSTISANVTIEENVIIEEGVYIGPNSFIGPNCHLKKGCNISANCSLVQDVTLGESSSVHFGSVLGSDGFGYAPSKSGYQKIEQLGGLIIGDNVEIGSSCTIDRGALGDTQIHDGVKLDNQVHIAHNVSLGENSAIAACCAIAGSTSIGKNLQMGGLSGILGHLSICDDVLIGAHTLVTKNIDNPGNYVGIMPTQEQKDWAKSSIFIKKRG
jgi:UDP-3-O-[3-hydroxymyristoyl] glucosamine N-acyltransferase